MPSIPKKVVIAEPDAFAAEELQKLKDLGFAIVFKKPGGAYAVVDLAKATPPPR